MGNEFNELATFISDFWSYNIDKITKEKSLDDLGMYADDKKEFLKSFIKKFNINQNDINFEKFCEPETFNPLFLFRKKKKDQRKTISIIHLISVMEKKVWFDPD